MKEELPLLTYLHTFVRISVNCRTDEIHPDITYLRTYDMLSISVRYCTIMWYTYEETRKQYLFWVFFYDITVFGYFCERFLGFGF